MMQLAEAHAWNLKGLAYALQECGANLVRMKNDEGESISNQIRRCGFLTFTPNGIEECAEKAVMMLEAATGYPHLETLTLLPFRRLFARCALLRPVRAWCAECLETAQSHEGAIHEQLLWSIRVVSVCPVHSRVLDLSCQSCGSILRPVGIWARPGHCDRCGAWLGVADKQERVIDSRHDVTQQQLWYAAQVGNLLALGPRVDPATVQGDFRCNFSELVKNLNLPLGTLAKRTRCQGYQLDRLLNGMPSTLDVLLRVCYHVGVSLDVLFMKPGSSATQISALRSPQYPNDKRLSQDDVRAALYGALQDNPPRNLAAVAADVGRHLCTLYTIDSEVCKEITRRSRKLGSHYCSNSSGVGSRCPSEHQRTILEASLQAEDPTPVTVIARSLGYKSTSTLYSKFRNLCRAISSKIARIRGRTIQSCQDPVGQQLHRALSEVPPPSLLQVATRLGVTFGVLRRRYPKLCDEVLERRSEFEANRQATLREILTGVLHEDPAPSMAQVVRRLGMSRACLSEHFPNLCSQISRRYLEEAAKARESRRDELERGVLEIASQLIHNGVYPSLTRVTALLPTSVLHVRLALHTAMQKARKILGLAALEHRGARR